MKVIKYADFFCGLGAFHQAFNKCATDKLNFKCVYACDIDEGIRNIYNMNYNIFPDGDINSINVENIPDFDILCAGFPCQPFSIAGNKNGFNDEKNGNLFNNILRIVDIKNPKILILENVKNLCSIENGNIIKKIVKELCERKYYVNYKITNSQEYNSPQKRQRVIIVANIIKPYIFSEPNYAIKNVKDIIDDSEKNEYNYNNKYNLINKVTNGQMLYILVNKETGNGGRQGERIYSIDAPGITICASSGGPGGKTGLYLINGKIRQLNIIESFRMFGFPDTYKYNVAKSSILSYLGNSIVINVLVHIINDLYDILNHIA